MTEKEIFELNDSSPEESWLHGEGNLRSWFTGSWPADSQKEFAAEFDLELRGQLGATVADALELNAEAMGSAHAGILVNCGYSLDMYRGAGLFAAVRAEASATAQVSVSASLSLSALEALVGESISPEVRPYADILFKTADLRAGVWARGAFAAMAVGELVAAVSLFPADGESGITAHLRYGYAWGWGASWGTVINIGFKPDSLFERVSLQVSNDVQRALNGVRASSNLDLNSPVYALTEVAEAVLPQVMSLLVRLARLSTTGRLEERQKQSLLEECVESLRDGLAAALLPRLIGFCADLLGSAQSLEIEGETYRKLEDASAALHDARENSAAPPETVMNAALDGVLALVTAADILPAPTASTLQRALRCAAALVLVVEPGIQVDSARLSALFSVAGGPGTPFDTAVAVITAELDALLKEHPILPGWVSTLVGPTEEVVALLLGEEGRDRSADARLFLQLLQTLVKDLLESDVWTSVSEVLPGDIRDALAAAVTVLVEVLTEVLDGHDVNHARFREGLSACLLTTIATPLTHILHEVADHGLRAVPDALNTLADQADTGAVPVDLRSSWEDIAWGWFGISVGLPMAVLLRKASATTQNWCETRLPGELDFLTRSLALHEVCERIHQVGSATALGEFQFSFIPELGKHLFESVIDSLEFALNESEDLFEAVIGSVVDSIAQSFALLLVAPFKALEATVQVAEQALTKLRDEAERLRKDVLRLETNFLNGAQSVAREIRQSVDNLRELLVQAIIDHLLPDALTQVKISVPGVSEDVVRGLVAEVVRAHTGGVLDAVEQATNVMADALSIGAEALRETAETQQGSTVRQLATTEWNASMPTVTIPITVDIPVPLAPPIRINVGELTVPSAIVVAMTEGILFDSLGIGPLFDSLDLTVNSLRATRLALGTVRSQIDKSTAPQQRKNLNQAKAVGTLSIEVLAPQPGAATPTEGEITFRVHGANLSFTDPASASLPGTLPKRIQVLLNGTNVTARATKWTQPQPNVLQGSFYYTANRTPSGEVEGQVQAGPVGVAVVINDGYGAKAQKAWHFVTQAPTIAPGVVTVMRGRKGRGIGSYDLMSPADQMFAFDYDHSGRLDHLVLYRPGSGIVHILKNTNRVFSPVFITPAGARGIGSYDLMSPADRMFAFDYDHSGRLDHLVLYRPGSGIVHILKNTNRVFSPVFITPAGARGIGSYDLMSPADRMFAFDYDHSGRLDHLVLYRPGSGIVHILKNTNGVFSPVFITPAGARGIGSYDLMSPADRMFAFDYDHSGRLDHLVLYRPGSGIVHILKNTNGVFSPVFITPAGARGIGSYDLMSPADQMFAFDYDHSGRLDHLVLYRPRTGTTHILKNQSGAFAPSYAEGDPGRGIGGHSLSSAADRIQAFDYDQNGKDDHLAVYRPGAGLVWILKTTSPIREQTPPEAVGDFTGDGKTDIAAFYRVDTNNTNLWLFNGANNLHPELVWQSGAGKWASDQMKLAVGDFTGDGKTDIAAFYRVDTNNTNLWLFNGANNLHPELVWQSGAGKWASDQMKLAVGDFTGDGKTDIAAFYRVDTNNTNLWLFNGANNLHPELVWQCGAGKWASDQMKLAVGDFTGDGKTDIAAFYRVDTNNTNLWLFNGANNLHPELVWQSGAGKWASDQMKLAVGDFTGDGKTDIAAFYRVDTNNTNLWLFNGANNLHPELVWQSGAGKWASDQMKLAVGDFTGDGKTDIAAFYRVDTNNTNLWLFNGANNLHPELVWQSGAGKWASDQMKLAVGDFTGDGKTDIAAFYRVDTNNTNLWLFNGANNLHPELVWQSGAGEWDWGRMR